MIIQNYIQLQMASRRAMDAGKFRPLRKQFVKNELARMRQFYEALLKNYPDVLSVRQVAQFTGYGEGSVAKWCSKQELKSFFIRQKFKIPKEYLLDFLVSRYFIGIAVKSEKHQKFNEKIKKLREVSCGE